MTQLAHRELHAARVAGSSCRSSAAAQMFDRIARALRLRQPRAVARSRSALAPRVVARSARREAQLRRPWSASARACSTSRPAPAISRSRSRAHVPGATVDRPRSVGGDARRSRSSKLAKRGLADRVSLVVGDAQELPQQNCEIDAATIAFGIRNVPDRAAALRELARVVRPGRPHRGARARRAARAGMLGAAARFHTPPRRAAPRRAGSRGAREYRTSSARSPRSRRPRSSPS